MSISNRWMILNGIQHVIIAVAVSDLDGIPPYRLVGYGAALFVFSRAGDPVHRWTSSEAECFPLQPEYRCDRYANDLAVSAERSIGNFKEFPTKHILL
jgi:hypothetical protein